MSTPVTTFLSGCATPKIYHWLKCFIGIGRCLSAAKTLKVDVNQIFFHQRQQMIRCQLVIELCQYSADCSWACNKIVASRSAYPSEISQSLRSFLVSICHWWFSFCWWWICSRQSGYLGNLGISPNCRGNLGMSPNCLNCLGNLGISSPNCPGTLGMWSPNCVGDMGISGDVISSDCLGNLEMISLKNLKTISPDRLGILEMICADCLSGDDVPRLLRQFGDDVPRLPRQFGDIPRLPGTCVAGRPSGWRTARTLSHN